MANDTLKNLIRQYIKTNGRNEITGQILQDILIAMVDAYPNLDNYVKKTGDEMSGDLDFILNKRILISVAQSGRRLTWLSLGRTDMDGTAFDWLIESDEQQTPYVGLESNGKFWGAGFKIPGGLHSEFLKADGSKDTVQYLPLGGGVLTGSLVTNGTTQGIRLRAYFDNETISIQQFNSETLQWVNVCSLSGPGYVDGKTYHGDQYVVNNGTDAEFLKADGSLDNNAYVVKAPTDWSAILFDSASSRSYMSAPGETFTMAPANGRWAPFSTQPGILQVTGGRSVGANIQYKCLSATATTVLVFLYNLDNPQQIIMDNVEIRP